MGIHVQYIRVRPYTQTVLCVHFPRRQLHVANCTNVCYVTVHIIWSFRYSAVVVFQSVKFNLIKNETETEIKMTCQTSIHCYYCCYYYYYKIINNPRRKSLYLTASVLAEMHMRIEEMCNLIGI